MTKWISVHDKLPRSGMVVLVLSSEKFITTSSKVGLARYWNKKDAGGRAHWQGSMTHDDNRDIDTITHWMKLPHTKP